MPPPLLNVIGGAFSNNLSLAFRIERGEIVGRAKDVSIAGNVYQDLRHIEAISRELSESMPVCGCRISSCPS